MEKLSVASLTEQSDLVIVGTVVDVRTVIENRNIWTIAEVRSGRQIKGSASGNTVLLRVPGGVRRVGGRTIVTRVEDAPVIHEHQKVLLFLSGRPPQYFSITGLNQGLFRIEKRNEKEILLPSTRSFSSPMLLEEFVVRVENTLRVAK